MNCKKCKDTGWYAYDENHSKVCEACCKHDQGYWLLKEHYGESNDKFCCKAGCGDIKDAVPEGSFEFKLAALEPNNEALIGEINQCLVVGFADTGAMVQVPWSLKNEIIKELKK